MDTKEIEQLVATLHILQEENKRVWKKIKAADEVEELTDYYTKVLAATMALAEVILDIRGLK